MTLRRHTCGHVVDWLPTAPLNARAAALDVIDQMCGFSCLWCGGENGSPSPSDDVVRMGTGGVPFAECRRRVR